jgi:hypothetical protein
VILQRRADGAWRNVKTASLDERSQFRFEFRARWNRYRTFRVIWEAQDDDHVAGRSAGIRILAVPDGPRRRSQKTYGAERMYMTSPTSRV